MKKPHLFPRQMWNSENNTGNNEREYSSKEEMGGKLPKTSSKKSL